jgi:hypothetical protein
VDTGIDPGRVKAFAGRVMRGYAESMVTLMIDISSRTGLFDALAQGPGTSVELAERAGLNERYVREILGALTTGEIVEYDPATRRYLLPPEHALCLTGDGVRNMSPISRITMLLASTCPPSTPRCGRAAACPTTCSARSSPR